MGVFSDKIRVARATKSDVAGRRWIYVPYDRLNDSVGPLSAQPATETGAIFVESREKANRREYHKKKLTLLLSNERHFALELAAKGAKIVYLAGADSIPLQLSRACSELGIRRVTTVRPAERELRHDLQSVESVEIQQVTDPAWITTIEEFKAAESKPPYVMDRFYRKVRQRTGILMANGRPIGGKWSYDEENRQRYRGKPLPPQRPSYSPDDITREVMDLVEQHFPKHFGNTAGFDLPCTAADCSAYWSFVLRDLLPLFGPYEDAMSTNYRDLFHSKASALINLGRLIPWDLVKAVERDFQAGRIPLPSAEGFIRQILGWREYMHWIHETTDGYRNLAVWYEKGKADNSPSALNADRPLPAAYWGKKSGWNCLDTVVAQVVEEGWSHHITRLMVLSNIATLAGISPRELTDWFWFAYIDAYDWVVEPNVLGMATYGDGGLTATKPYVSGTAYINRMSDYCGRCQFNPKKRFGENACPITAMYWTFLERQQDLLANNIRMQMPLRTLHTLSPADRRSMREYAEMRIAELLATPREY